MDKTRVLELLKKNGLCVLATANKVGKTEAAVMAYVIKDDFTILIFTDEGTRKYKNLLENNLVSIVVGGLKDDPETQIDGTVKILEGEEVKAAENFAFAVHPEWKDYVSATTKWLEVKPNWLRFTDFSKSPPEIVEITEW